MTTAKEDLELQKLGTEVAEASRQSRRPWLLQLALPALVASLASGAGGYLFGESAAEKSRAELRKQVIAQCFAVDNEIAGKRKQMLDFIEATLAKDDPELGTWLQQERRVVDQHLAELETERLGLVAKPGVGPEAADQARVHEIDHMASRSPPPPLPRKPSVSH